MDFFTLYCNSTGMIYVSRFHSLSYWCSLARMRDKGTPSPPPHVLRLMWGTYFVTYFLPNILVAFQLDMFLAHVEYL